jgi:hypothetical protein
LRSGFSRVIKSVSTIVLSRAGVNVVAWNHENSWRQIKMKIG